MSNLYIIYIFILFILIFNIGTFWGIRKSFKRREKRLYVYLLISVFGWALMNAMSDIIKDYDYALIAAQLSILFPLNLLNAIVQMIRDFPKVIEGKKYTKLFQLLNILTLVFTIVCVILLRTQYNIVDFQVIADGAAAYTPGELYSIEAVVAALEISLIVFFWLRNYKYYTLTQKNQVLTFAVILVFVAISMVLGLVILPLSGLSSYGPLMFLSLALLLFMVNKLLQVKIVLVDIKSDLVNIFGAILASMVVFVFWNLLDLRVLDLNLDSISKFLVSFQLLFLVYFVYKRFVSFFDRGRAKHEEQIQQFVEKSLYMVTLEHLRSSIRQILMRILNTKGIRIYILPTYEEKELITQLGMWLSQNPETPIINKELLIENYFEGGADSVLSQKIFNYFQSHKIDFVMTISNQSEVVGYITVSNMKTTLNESDYDRLLLLSNNISVSISRAMIYGELEKFNETLQQKVDLQTEELQIKISELEEARRKEADMIDIMGHELRTPATIVKLNAQLLEQIIQKKDINSLQKYVTRIQEGVEREIKLINTLLSSAKLEGDKIKIEPEEVDLKPEIDIALHAHEKEAERKGLKLVDNTPEQLSTVFGDHARVVEVVNNLISNAVKYTEKGCITVEASEYGDMVQVDIIDTGLGIPEKDIPNLGKKFFRVQTYIQAEDSDDVDIVRPGGTGLGLYVVFSLVEKMGGEVHVQSELGKGSVFSFTLPKYVGQKVLNSQRSSKDMFERLGLKKSE